MALPGNSRKVILFIATSLDGFIARKNGGIDWLYTDGDYGYEKFYASIDTTLTGGKTYRQALTFGGFPYPGKTNYVFTRTKPQGDRNPVTFISSDIVQFVRSLKHENGKHIWLVGGGEINTILLNAGLIDEMVISIHPVILGDGVPLFRGMPRTTWFRLSDQRVFEGGLLQVTYEKNRNQ